MPTSPSLHVSTTHQARAAQNAALIIEQSWERCATLDPASLRDPNPLSRADLDARREASQGLLRHAQAGISALEVLAGSARSIVLLADAQGLILHESGAREFLGKARRVALQPGVNWAESSRGTNAIGTALHDGRAIRVHGAEHFLPCNRILSCHAAPIFSGCGEIIGVLDLSGPADEIQAYALGLVQMYASRIGNRMLRDTPLRQLVFQADATQLDTARQGILLIDDAQRIAGANETALHLLEADWGLIGRPVGQWLDGALDLGAAPGHMHHRNGRMLVGTLHAPRSGERPATAPRQVRAAFPAAKGLPRPDGAMQALAEPAIRAIDAGLAVLLQGETGSGKEVLARLIHASSCWRSGSFIAINCGALPESLVESELFGYTGGAFTGARKEGARGLLQQAHRGVVFLDEIGDMPLALQTRLLRVLQEREVQPLGSEKRIPLEFGLVSASHRDLKAMVARGAFRADLYYRLQDMVICVPALRARTDLPEFLQTQFTQLGAGRPDSETLAQLVRYGWPGNYREMHSILRRLACLYPGEGPVHTWMLPEEIREFAVARRTPARAATAPTGIAAGKALRDLEQSAIERTMAEFDGNISLAAEHLGIHRSTLYRRLKRQGRRA